MDVVWCLSSLHLQSLEEENCLHNLLLSWSCLVDSTLMQEPEPLNVLPSQSSSGCNVVTVRG